MAFGTVLTTLHSGPFVVQVGTRCKEKKKKNRKEVLKAHKEAMTLRKKISKPTER